MPAQSAARSGKQCEAERLVPEGALTEIWTSPPYNHCMFTARPDLDPALEQRFAEALSGMSYDNPNHRAVLEAEGLQRWVEPHLDGYESLARGLCATGIFQARGDRPKRDRSAYAQLKIFAKPAFVILLLIEGATHGAKASASGKMSRDTTDLRPPLRPDANKRHLP